MHRSTSLHCLARTWLAGAAMTTRGMQHLGVLYALEPELKALYADPLELAAARVRHMEHVNTHPFMAPLFIGILLSLEGQAAAKTLSAQTLSMIKTTTATTLSALGDSFFSGTVLVFWALSTSQLLVLGHILPAALWTSVLFLCQLLFRIWTFFLGLRHGLLALQRLRSLNLINWGDRLKLVNPLLLAALLWQVSPHATGRGSEEAFLWGLLCLGVAGFLVVRAHVPRLLVAVVLFSMLLARDAARIVQ